MGYIQYLLCLGLITSFANGQTREERLANNRLPGDLRPYHYIIELKAEIYDDEENKTFDGTSDVFFTCVQATNQVYLNIRDYEPRTTEIALAPENNVTAPQPVIQSIQADLEREFYIITLTGNMVPGARYQVRFTLEWYLSLNQRGFYALPYTANRERRWIAATDFVPSNARAAFPSFDEPEYKATFDITLIRRIEYRSISNMNILRSEQRPNNWIADVYARTPVMSVCMVNLIICDFQYRERVSERGTVSRIWARTDQIDYTERVWGIMTSVLEWYENYTAINYPLPKLDHLALPQRRGHMGFGLVVYPERLLLFDEAESDVIQWLRCFRTLAKDIAHQWFGAIVTTAWWDDVWLNEAVGEFLNLEPFGDLLRWNTRRMQAARNMRVGFRVSGFPNVGAVVRDIPTPQDSDGSFNAIVRFKGSATLRMLKYALGEDTLRRGMQRFVSKHQYSTATTDDMWTDLQEQVDADNVREPDGFTRLDVRQKFDAWLRQEGMPLVTFNRSTEFGVLARVNQTRFVMPMDAEVNATSPYGYKWWVPITTFTEDDPSKSRATRYYMPPDGLDITAGLPPASKLMVVNVDQVGLYRVMYDNNTQNQLLSTLDTNDVRIPTENRGVLIEDMFRILRAFRMEETPALEFTKYLFRENQWVVWSNVVEHIRFYDLMFMRESAFGFLERYWRSKVDPVYSRNRFVRPEDIGRRILRRLMTAWSCAYNNLNCIQDAWNFWEAWWRSPITRPIEPDQHQNYMCVAVRTGEEFEWNVVFALYRVFGNYRTTERYLRAMACTRDYYLLERYFVAMEDGTIPNPIGAFVLSFNPLGMEIVWRHLRNNWQNSTFGDTKRALLVAQSIGRNRPEELEEFEDFAFLYPPVDEDEQRVFDIVRRIITRNIEWMQLNREPVANWLENQPSPTNLDSSQSYGQGAGGMLMAEAFYDLLDESRISRGWALQPEPDQYIDVLMQLLPDIE